MKPSLTVAHGLIRRCFGAADMAYLQQQVEFQSAITAMGTLDEFESTAGIGDHLLFQRDEIQWRIRWGTSSNAHAQSEIAPLLRLLV
jgi:hypothetical protein